MRCKFRGAGSFKAAVAALAVAVGAGMVAGEADARPGKGFSYGSRGSRTYSQPPATQTAPGVGQPMQKSITQPGQPSVAQAARPAAGAAQAAPARSNMFRNLFLGGLIGAGLASIFGVGAFASVAGFLLQTLLIGGLIYMAIAFFRSRSQMASAGAGAPGAGATGPTARAQSYAAAPERTAAYQAPAAGPANAALTLQPADFDAFERLLSEVQTAYGRRDRRALETRTTPEMLSYFAEELAENERRGVENRISGIKLLQGDLSEAWNEGGQDYATVAMRYSITDVTVDSRSGRVVDGSERPAEVTELWTFVRRRGAGPQGWELSAIQQT